MARGGTARTSEEELLRGRRKVTEWGPKHLGERCMLGTAEESEAGLGRGGG